MMNASTLDIFTVGLADEKGTVAELTKVPEIACGSEIAAQCIRIRQTYPRSLGGTGSASVECPDRGRISGNRSIDATACSWVTSKM